MADDVVIRAEGLGKKYLIGHMASRERYITLRDELIRGAHNLWRKTTDMVRGRPIVAGESIEEFWALKDVSFEVKRGEVLGIIGRNGAGKSTLLKVLSRITEPTEGRVTIDGRVASLLEVGTGFHPELTGRENIYLNGTILGMTRAEIRRKFDEIVTFAEVEKFLDTPTKRYSSGMYVRLAFAVAAHLDPEILIVDEVLAVGDAEFQKKSLGKMSDVASGGRTVLFVSHNLAAVDHLCARSLALQSGKIIAEGETHEIISIYRNSVHQEQGVPLEQRIDRQGNGKLRFIGVQIYRDDGQEIFAPCCGDPAIIALVMKATTPVKNVQIDFCIDNHLGNRIVWLSNQTNPGPLLAFACGKNRALFRIPRLPLVPGVYFYTLFCSVNGEIIDWVQQAGTFEVGVGDFFGNGVLPPGGQGDFLVEHLVLVENSKTLGESSLPVGTR
jgi:lipopolysaccharide transport system ATP-binding protein